MKKFAFSLEKVLGYKRQVLGVLKNELSRLQLQRREIEQKMDEIDCEFEATNQKLSAQMRDGMSPHTVAVYKAYLDSLNRRTLTLLDEKRKLLKMIAAKQEEIVRMNCDISGLERLRDKQFEAYCTQERKEQETFIEEFVSHVGSTAGQVPARQTIRI